MQSSNLKQLSPKVSVDMTVLLGKGSTGNVYKGVGLEPEPHPIAVKVIPLEEINNQVTSYLLECQLQALKATSKVPNQSIVRLEQIVVVEGNCYIATELLEGGTLKQYISQCKKIEPTKALSILQKLLSGYLVLKENGIIHRDLKPENILFEHVPGTETELTPKIIDFGYCTVEKVQKKPKMFYNVGSPRYMSPEAYTGNQYSQKSDIWAIGIILYQMLTGTNFDKGKNIVETFKLIREKGIPIPSSLNSQCRKILQHMLMLDPNRRYSCEEVLEEIAQGQGQAQTESEQTIQVPSPTTRYPPEGSANRNIRDLRNTIVNERMLNSPVSRSPNPRMSWLAETPLKNSGFLTKSVGFAVSPMSRDNRLAMLNPNNNLGFKNEFAIMLGKSLNQAPREGPLSDRNMAENPRASYRVINTEQKPTEHQNFNRSLNESSSEQNLKRFQAQNNSMKVTGRENLVPGQGERGEQVSQERVEERKERERKNVFPFRFQDFRNQRVITTPTSSVGQGKLIPQMMEVKNVPQNQRVHFFHPNQMITQPQPQPQQVQVQAQRPVHHQIHIQPPANQPQPSQQTQPHFIHQHQQLPLQHPHQHQLIQQQTLPQIQVQVQSQQHQHQQAQFQHQQQPQHIHQQPQLQHMQPQPNFPPKQQQQGQHIQVHMQGQPHFKISKDPPPFVNRNIRVMPMTPHGDIVVKAHM